MLEMEMNTNTPRVAHIWKWLIFLAKHLESIFLYGNENSNVVKQDGTMKLRHLFRDDLCVEMKECMGVSKTRK